MVYKIRNKTFFFTLNGYKNNYSVKILNCPIEVKSDSTFAYKSFEGGPHYIRFCQLYRNISRKAKQYLYGNKILEAEVMNTIRSFFRIPYECETPVHLIQSEPLRRFINQGDRDYELMNYNAHPYQTAMYSKINEEVQEQMEDVAMREQGQVPLEEQFEHVLDKRLEKAKEQFGNTIPTEVFHQVMMGVYTDFLIAKGAEKARTPNGDFNDFVETRRPFVEPNVSSQDVNTK